MECCSQVGVAPSRRTMGVMNRLPNTSRITPRKKAAKEASRETWISLIATNTKNAEGVSAYDAYVAKFRPTPGELADLEAEVEQYKQEHGLR